MKNKRLPTANCQLPTGSLPTANCQLPTVILPTVYCQLPTGILPIANCLLLFRLLVLCQLPTANCQLPTVIKVLPLPELKKDLEFNQEISEIVNILKNIAISRFHHLRQRKKFEEFGLSLESFLEAVDFEEAEHPFLRLLVSGSRLSSQTANRKPQTELVVAITSNEPFVGELNIRVINAALGIARSGSRLAVSGVRPQTANRKPQTELVVVGERGRNYLEEMGEHFIYFRGIDEEFGYQQIKQVRDYLLSQYLRENLKQVIIVYPHFVSFGHQEVEVFQLLPYKPVGSMQYAVGKKKSVGNKNQYAVGKKKDKKLPTANCQLPTGFTLIEPSLNRVVDYLIRLWAGEKLHQLFYESKLSELAARAMHMEGSRLELSRTRGNLKTQYMRGVHEAMDKANRDIFASRTLWGE